MQYMLAVTQVSGNKQQGGRNINCFKSQDNPKTLETLKKKNK